MKKTKVDISDMQECMLDVIAAIASEKVECVILSFPGDHLCHDLVNISLTVASIDLDDTRWLTNALGGEPSELSRVAFRSCVDSDLMQVVISAPLDKVVSRWFKRDPRHPMTECDSQPHPGMEWELPDDFEVSHF